MKNKQSSLPKKEVELVFNLYSNGEFHKAVDLIKGLNAKYPNQPLLFNLIGACYKELGELSGAAKMFGFAELSQSAIELENAIKRNATSIDDLTHCLLDEITLVQHKNKVDAV